MGMSESHDSEAGDPVHAGHDTTARITLASLRSQVTSTATPPHDQAMGTRARFRQEERLRADLRRERRLRQQAITERVNAMKANIAKDLAVQHVLTLDALENELRGTMQAELETMERDALAAEEARARHERLAQHQPGAGLVQAPERGETTSAGEHSGARQLAEHTARGAPLMRDERTRTRVMDRE